MSRFHALTVAAIRRETRDAAVVELKVPPALAETFRFVQGQYLTLRATLGGEEVRRSYSICSAVQDGVLRVGVKRVAGGTFSTWVNESLRAGATVEAMPPEGNFHAPLDPARAGRYLAFAAGSGITPVLGVLKTTLLAEPRSIFTLVYGNRASSTIMFREDIEDLKNRFLSRLTVIHVLTRERQDAELFNGRIDRAKCAALFAHWIDPISADWVFVCGPAGMSDEVLAALAEAGVPRARIKVELFAADRGPGPPRAAAGAAAGRATVTVVLDGRATEIEIERGVESILDAGLRHGLDMPFACKRGVCSTCRALKLEGEVAMDANFALEDYEVARGFVLTCQSYPLSERVVVDYDKR